MKFNEILLSSSDVENLIGRSCYMLLCRELEENNQKLVVSLTPDQDILIGVKLFEDADISWTVLADHAAISEGDNLAGIVYYPVLSAAC